MASDSEKNFRLWIPPDLLAKAEEVAKRERISLDQLVVEALESYINRHSLKEGTIDSTSDDG